MISLYQCVHMKGHHMEDCMDYNEFTQYIKENIKEVIDHDILPEVVEVIKNNDKILKTLVIRDPDRHIAPTIYLEEYYENYIQGEAIDDVIGKIGIIYEEYRIKEDFDMSCYSKFEYIKDKLAIKLVNYKKNEKLLSEVPYKKYLDMAIIFYCVIQEAPFENTILIVKNSHMNMWKVTADELLEKAKDNAPNILPPVIASMEHIIEEMIMDKNEISEEYDIFDDLEEGMFVLTNKTKTNGASCILYDGVLSEFGDIIKSDFYIIPSSIHEVILVKDEEHIDKDELNNMVVSVNTNEVMDIDILSDHVYKYLRDKDEIIMC